MRTFLVESTPIPFARRFLILGVAALSFSNAIADGIPHRLDQIEAKLDTLLAVTNTCTMSQFLNGECDDAPVTASVSFCFGQGSALDAAMAYGLGLKSEVALGVGNTTAVIAEVKVGAEMPVIPTRLIFLPPPLPPMPVGALVGPPLPTEAKIGAGLQLGRGHDTCMDVPIEIPPESLEDVRMLLADVNDVYQNRLKRVLAFGNRVADRRQFLQCAGDAFEDILTNQIQSFDPDDKTGFLGDLSIQKLRDCTDLPQSLKATFANNAEALFAKLPEEEITSMDEYTSLMDAIDRIGDRGLAQQMRNEICSALPQSRSGVRKWKSSHCPGGGDVVLP